MGRAVPVTRERGQGLVRADGLRVLITLHPPRDHAPPARAGRSEGRRGRQRRGQADPAELSRLGQPRISTSTCTAWCWTGCTGAALTARRNSSKYRRPPMKRCRRCCTRSSPARRKLLTRRGVLDEEEGSTYMADNDGDSDEARALRPLQAAPDQWPGPLPGTNSPLDCLCPGSAAQACVRAGPGALPELRR